MKLWQSKFSQFCKLASIHEFFPTDFAVPTVHDQHDCMAFKFFFTKSCFLTYSQNFCVIQYNHISIAYLVTSVLSSLVPDVLAFEETLTEHSESTLMSHL